jgi:phosphate transport system substrate-binding protein
MVGFKNPKSALLVTAMGICFFPQIGMAQQQSIFCLEGGVQIGVERFETRDNKFFLYVPGSSSPLEYPASSVKGINVPCQAAGSSNTQNTQNNASSSPNEFGVQGSNTIGERLMPMLIEAYGMKKFGVKPTNKLIGNEEEQITLKNPSGASTVIDLQSHGSGTATPGLLEGKAIIGMASRRLTADEQKKLSDKYNVNILAPGNEHVLALDGLAVIVNPTNSVKQLSLDQIAQIFSGEITNWHDVGGADLPINVYRRDNKSGTFDTFKSLVLQPSGGTKRDISPQAKPFESSESLSDEVAHDPKGIGFIGLPYIGKNNALSISSPCGIASSPSKFTVKNEEYPLARRLYLYTLGVPANPTARELLEFALSDDAQPTVTDAEFVNQAIDFEEDDLQNRWAQDVLNNSSRTLGYDKPIPASVANAFNRAMGQTRRTTIAFRFEKGSAQLDNRALQDVARLSRYLASPAMSNKRFYLIGFADSSGGWASNQNLATQRAVAVGLELQKMGLRVTRDNISAFSYLAPVACNESDAGAAKNRRVEVWIER